MSGKKALENLVYRICSKSRNLLHIQQEKKATKQDRHAFGPARVLPVVRRHLPLLHTGLLQLRVVRDIYSKFNMSKLHCGLN